LNYRLNAPLPTWRWLKMPEDHRLDRALREVRRWLDELVASARERLERDPERAARPANFLEAMLAAKDPDGRPFPDEVVLANALTMLLAGEDTTAYTLAWAMHELERAPAAVARLRVDIDAALGKDALVPPEIDVADKLAYAGAIANETMRLRPVAPLFFLQPNVDVELGGLRVPKDTHIVLLARAQAVAPAAFADPTAFRPERWLEGPGPGKPHDAAASIPFGSGPRICPGRSLALLEMRVVLATIYRSFDPVRVGRADDVTERMAFTMMPENLRFRLRRLR
jgi:cytochrome P450